MEYIKPEMRISVFDTAEIVTGSSGGDPAANSVFEAAGEKVDMAAAADVGSILQMN